MKAIKEQRQPISFSSKPHSQAFIRAKGFIELATVIGASIEQVVDVFDSPILTESECEQLSKITTVSGSVLKQNFLKKHVS